MKLPLDGPYDVVVGIGQTCANAAYMSRWNLRACSGPFDWILGQAVGLRRTIDLICTDFRGFLDRESLRQYENPRGPQDDQRCDYYEDVGTGYRLPHDFPRGVPLAESYPQVRAKYDRRIARMYRRVGEGRRSLFVYWARYEEISDADMVESVARLRARFAASHVDLLVIEHRESAEGISEVWCAAPGTVRVRGQFVDTGGSLAMGNLKLNAEVYSSIPRAFCLRRMAWRRTLVRAWIHLYVQTYPKRVRRAKREELINRWLGKELF